jgi:hypothetical protein
VFIEKCFLVNDIVLDLNLSFGFSGFMMVSFTMAEDRGRWWENRSEKAKRGQSPQTSMESDRGTTSKDVT